MHLDLLKGEFVGEVEVEGGRYHFEMHLSQPLVESLLLGLKRKGSLDKVIPQKGASVPGL
jgi:hypothetical protein